MQVLWEEECEKGALPGGLGVARLEARSHPQGRGDQDACGGRCASSLAFLPERPGEPPKVVEHVSDFRKTSCQRFAGSTWQQQQRQK